MTRHVDPADGSSIEAAAGEPFEIALPENPTTGYLWHVAERGALEDAAAPAFESGGSAVGAGGTRTFRLTAPQPGRSTVALTLQRPGGGPPVQARRITVTARATGT